MLAAPTRQSVLQTTACHMFAESVGYDVLGSSVETLLGLGCGQYARPLIGVGTAVA